MCVCVSVCLVQRLKSVASWDLSHSVRRDHAVAMPARRHGESNGISFSLPCFALLLVLYRDVLLVSSSHCQLVGPGSTVIMLV